MPTLQIRLDEETFERVRDRGGSPWARDVLVESLAAAVRPDHGLSEEPAAVGEPEVELRKPDPIDERDVVPEDDPWCPRWMHHFAGVTCPVCGETP